MTAIIVPRPAARYGAGMRHALAKLLLMLAVLLMPFGMAAPAAAAANPAHPAAAMAMQHCPDQRGGPHHQGGFAECTMACAAALPAVASSAQPALLFVVAPTLRVLAEPLLGLHPETATPPPR